MADFRVVATFNYADLPSGGLIADAAGNLYGATAFGGSYSEGSIFELAKVGDGYSTTVTTLASLAPIPYQAQGYIIGGLAADLQGNLYLQTSLNNQFPYDITYKLNKTEQGYSSSLNPIISAANPGGDYPGDGLLFDATGDIFGTDSSADGLNGGYTSSAFELVKTATGYTPKTLVSFDANNAGGTGSLTLDAAGNLIGLTDSIGPGYLGTIFEIPKTETGYSSASVALAHFDFSTGLEPSGNLTFDAEGDIFGTTLEGEGNDGTVFELARNGSGYDTKLTTIASFNGTDGSGPEDGVIVDAAGNLFGTTNYGGASGLGTVFEIVKMASGYDPTPKTLLSFDGLNGVSPTGSLYADKDGNLFGVTEESEISNGGGEPIEAGGLVYELTDSGFEPLCYCPGTLIGTDTGEVPIEALEIGDLVRTLDGRLEPIRWIGRRSYAGRFIAGKPTMLPVCIKAGAIADRGPKRDLWVSPGHAIFIDGHLIHARLLVNGVSIIQAESVQEVTYIHIELDRHAVILAEGCPAESFRDEVSRNQFANVAEYRALYPDERAPMRPYAPKLEDGFLLELVRCRIGLRAGIAPRPACEPGPLLGFLDVAGPERVCGWAVDQNRPDTPVYLDVLVGGRPMLHVIANRDRPDLRAAGLTDTRHAFEVTLPKKVCGPVEVRRSSDGASLVFTDVVRAKLAAIA